MKNQDALRASTIVSSLGASVMTSCTTGGATTGGGVVVVDRLGRLFRNRQSPVTGDCSCMMGCAWDGIGGIKRVDACRTYPWTGVVPVPCSVVLVVMLNFYNSFFKSKQFWYYGQNFISRLHHWLLLLMAVPAASAAQQAAGQAAVAAC
jgi:hypothetical protein